MPRVNRRKQLALNFKGTAIGACWLTDDTQVGQQPVVPGEEGPGKPWQMETRPAGVVGRGTPIPGMQDGCNELAAGHGRLMRRYDLHVIPLSGSEDWIPGNGRVGDIDRNGAAMTLSEDKLTLRFDGGVSYRRDDVQGDTRFMDGLAAWTSRGRVRVYDVRLGRELDVAQVGPGAAKALAFRDASSRVWVLYQTDAHGGVCHRVDDAARGYLYGEKEHIYDPDVLVTQEECAIFWSRLEGQELGDQRSLTIQVLGEGMVSLTVATPGPTTPVPPVPPREPLAVTVIGYTSLGTAPMEVSVDYRISGAGEDPVRVWMLLDGHQVAGSDEVAGRITAVVDEPGEYRLKVRVTSGRRTPAETFAPRVVRVNAKVEPPPLPPVEPDPAVHLNRTAAADTVRLLYLDVLKREPDPSGLAHYVDALMAGTLDSAGLRTILTNAKNGGAK